jgi:hypothetical protein
MIKSKFGNTVRSKTEVAQVNEALLKCCATTSVWLLAAQDDVQHDVTRA